MKKLSICITAAALALAASSCAPSAYTLLVEMRQPSMSGMSIAGKEMAVVYLEDQEGADTLFSNHLADAFATALEEDYFGGQQAVTVYNLPKDPLGQYSSIDTLSQLAMELSPDVLFIIDTPLFSYKNDGSPKVTASVYAYDTMSRKDSVYRVTRSATLNSKDVDKELSAREVVGTSYVAQALGEKIAQFFESTWQNEYFTLMCYDDDLRSVEAVIKAEAMEWQSALNTWLDLVGRNSDTRMRGCYSYNIAVACYMLGDYHLALEWLDRADADYKVSNAPGLRKRVLAKLD